MNVYDVPGLSTLVYFLKIEKFENERNPEAVKEEDKYINNRENAIDALIDAVMRGELDRAQDLEKIWKFTNKEVRVAKGRQSTTVNLLWNAVYIADLSTCQWVQNTYKYTREEIMKWDVLREAVNSGDIELCNWIQYTFKFTTEDAREGLNDYFFGPILAIAAGDSLKMVKWVVDTFKLDSSDVEMYDHLAIRSAKFALKCRMEENIESDIPEVITYLHQLK
jgi:hypothetical protein